MADQLRIEVHRNRWGYTISLHEGVTVWSNQPWRPTFRWAVRASERMMRRAQLQKLRRDPVFVLNEPKTLITSINFAHGKKDS